MATAPTPNNTKTPNSSVKWGAIFIIFLMLLSGVAVFFGSQSATNQPTNPTDTTQTPLEQFSADDVSGTMVEIFNTAIVGGQTSDGDKTIFDEQLQSIPGVESVTSQFSPLNADGSVTYIANLNLSSSVDRAAFADAVYALDLFDSPEVYFQASVQVSAEHEVKNSKGQLTRITLPNTQIQAIVSSLTQKGDTINGTLAATFQGTKLVSAHLLETQNITASPSQISFSGEYPIKSLKAGLLVRGELDYFPGLSSENLSGEVAAINGVSSVAVPFLPFVNNTVFAEFKDASMFSSDLNSYFATHPESFESFSLTPIGFSVNLKNINFAEAKDLLSMKINEITSSNAVLSFTAPRTQFLIDANTTTASNSNTATRIQDYFESLDANAKIDIYQQGFFTIDSLTPPDTNIIYSIPNGEVSMAILPGRQVGDIIKGRIYATTSRGEISFPSGEEVIED